MKANYPADGVTKYDFYPKISKALGADADKPAYTNTCALRMSYALVHSGIKLPVAANGGSLIGDDKNNYWLRVKDLKIELARRFKRPDVYYELPPFTGNSDPALARIQLEERKKIVYDNFLSKIAST